MSDQRPLKTVPLGTSDIQISPLGVGAWAWGDRTTWGYGSNYNDADLREVFNISIAAGINFLDTAEIYGMGRSEKLIGEFLHTSGQKIVITTKFFPFPWRVRRAALLKALRGSLGRLGLPQVDLYLIHWPYPPLTGTWVRALGDAVQQGLTGLVGVSNFNIQQMRQAHSILADRSIPLSANQIHYSLLKRGPERTGLLDACRELGITPIAYSPLEMGMLTGKYDADHPPTSGTRRFRYSARYLARIRPLIGLLRELGEGHAGMEGPRTPGQVALNWVICKGAVPIPGAKNARQAQSNAGALGWQLTGDEVAALDAASDRVFSNQ